MFRWRQAQSEAAAARRRADSETDQTDGGAVLDNAPPRSAPGDDAGVELTDDRAIDAFAQVLRAFGQYSFDLEQETAISFSQQCDAWSRHLLTMAPPPGGAHAVELDAVEAEPREDAAAAGGAPRDWAAVLQFVLARRRREQQHVNTALGDLRQSIWAFAQSFGTALVEDQRADNHFKSQIDRLKVALERPSIEELKKEVVSAASNLSRLVTERQQTQRRRLDELGARVTDLAGQLREAKQENVRDPLTQLVNRKGFDEFLNRMVFMRDIFGETACMLMIDADRFKSINDTYGHPGGDAVLKALADCMVRSFPRKSDMVARYGGEEFAIILPDTSAQNARRLAERMLLSIRDLRIPRAGQVITVTVSIGVGELGFTESVQDWLDRTDQALYRAKVEGRDRVVEAGTGY